MNYSELTLKNGLNMPEFGLGTWQLTGRQCEKAVNMALEMGYPQIDTSDDYRNEERIGNVIQDYDRSKIFITSKVDDSKLQRDDVKKACNESLHRLNTDYLDLYLIHRPNPSIPIAETMIALNELVEENFVRSIGVSNFSLKGTKDAMKASDKPVCVNQIKIHPYHYPADEIQALKKEGIVVTAYSPLDTGQLIDDDFLTSIGMKYKKSAAQICLRYLLQKQLVVIPKASTEDHLREDCDIFSWKLSSVDMQSIDEITNGSLRG